jgi:hypothetical protein
MIQIRVIEDNDWEGETFSYVLQVTPEVAEEIDMLIQSLSEDIWSLELNTSYTPEQVEMLNDHVDNGYMDYINFYTIPEGAQIDEDLFYKGAGLNKVK